jgi:peptide/nickel transport system permease protein
LSGAGRSFAAYVVRRLLAVAVTVVLAGSLAFVVVGSLTNGVTLWAQAAHLPRFLSDSFLHHDFGYSRRYREGWWQVMRSGMGIDLTLVVAGLVIGNVAGVSAGLRAGARRRSARDRAYTVASAGLLSLPVYWFGSMTLTLFAPQSGYLVQIPFLSEYGGFVPFSDSPLHWLQSMWVPCLVVAAPVAAMTYRMTRAALAEAGEEHFVRSARAKGVRERRVWRRHALPAALPPVLSLAAVNMALLITNVVLVESAFNLPGFFKQADLAQFRGEQPGALNLGITATPPPAVVHLLVIEAAAIIAIGMVLCDLAQTWLDPRLRTRPR